MTSSLNARQAFWLWALVVVSLILSLTAFAATKTCSGTVCTPYLTAVNNGVACLRKNPINLRFLLHMASENDYMANGVLQDKATYAFAPCVDDITALALNGAPFLATGYAVENTTTSTTTPTTTTTTTSYYFTKNTSDKYLSVYGFGMSNRTALPEPGVSAGAVLVAKNGQDACGDASMVGVVTVLSLEIGMHKGYFNYIGQTAQTNSTAPNPHYDAALCGSSASAADKASSSSDHIDYCSKTINVVVAATNVQPARVGFVPTCNAKDECIMGDPTVYTCIGNVTGQKNCGLCYSNATILSSNVTLTVWVSYIGTDRKSVVMTSGGDNPMNYVNYARHQGFDAVTSKFNSLFKGNISTFGLALPSWP